MWCHNTTTAWAGLSENNNSKIINFLATDMTPHAESLPLNLMWHVIVKIQLLQKYSVKLPPGYVCQVNMKQTHFLFSPVCRPPHWFCVRVLVVHCTAWRNLKRFQSQTFHVGNSHPIIVDAKSTTSFYPLALMEAEPAGSQPLCRFFLVISVYFAVITRPAHPRVEPNDDSGPTVRASPCDKTPERNSLGGGCLFWFTVSEASVGVAGARIGAGQSLLSGNAEQSRAAHLVEAGKQRLVSRVPVAPPKAHPDHSVPLGPTS